MSGTARPAPAGRLLGLALGSLNTLVLLLIAIILAATRGTPEAPREMHPALGLGALMLLWLLTWWATARGLRACPGHWDSGWASTWARGIGLGLVTGIVGLGIVYAVTVVLVLIDHGITGDGATAVAYMTLYVPYALVAALIMGGAAGFAVATFDRLVLAFAIRA